MLQDRKQNRVSGVAMALFAISVATGLGLTVLIDRRAPFFGGLLIGLYFLFSIKVADQWEKVAVLQHMFLPPSFSSILLKVLELPDQLLDGNTLGTGAGREFAGELRQAALPLAAVEIGFLMAYKGPGALLGFERSL